MSKLPEKDLFHLIIDMRNLFRYADMIKLDLRKQVKNPKQSREERIRKYVDTMCEQYPDIESRIHKKLGISYDDVESKIKEYESTDKI